MSPKKIYLTVASRGALVLLLAVSLAAQAWAAAPERPSVRAVAKSVRAFSQGTATLIRITGTAPLAYSVRRPAERLLVVELPQVDASQLASDYNVRTPLVEGVRVRRVASTGASLEVTLRAPVRERSRLDGNELVLELHSAAESIARPADSPKPAAAAPASRGASDTLPASDNRGEGNGAAAQSSSQNQPQTSQGAQYGQPGFVGEPISLNVVNADIRDILNYITEQYGVNFVVDASVQRVPVTINVTDVPWNFALNSILKANRLGIEANGNILRLATLEVLKEEAKIRAEEEAARSRLREAELYNIPLVTEIVRLNYARASGTLNQASEGTGGFTGGVSSGSSTGDAGGAAGGGILPIIKRRLSRRGSVEVESRSNTLIVTDVQQNIDAIRRLIELLDQPEPQVEIETRIVLANRTFSRDLGVQLSAVVLNSRTGAVGFGGTLPGTVNVPNTGTPFEPGFLQPSAGLGANLATTVIGLTTGRIGTAQISAAITAAEQKGQAKVIATPRVTALNNRPAQIEAGSQIPIVTPQTSAGGGGGAVFTTTFVSVPLRLSITPQITEAGTVVLRVVMENNSVNRAFTNALGTPGIDTQRMQTEVLVPDGGTTVVGGVVNDRESETVDRTPGLGSLPVVGNLFKRRAVSRSTDEILFFITPRIYRPDYQGQRIDAQPSTGTRSIQIPQPVPLGNPETNTPAPVGPSQQQNPAPVLVVPPTAEQPGQANSGARP
jgi:type IV pilus assembly protein PilQ